MKKLYISLCLALLLVPGVRCPGQNPIAYYPFTGNANDASGNNLNGTLYGNPLLTTDLHGTPNSAYLFNGNDDYISLGDSPILKPTSAVSLSLFAYSSSWAGYINDAALAGNTQSGGYELYMDSGILKAYARRNGIYGIAQYSIASLSAGWHHFAMTFDGRYTILYIDGVAVNTNDAGATYPLQYGTPGNHTLIGAEAGSVMTEGDYFNGKIDEVRFYNIALTPAQIASLYTSALGLDQLISDPFVFKTYVDETANELVISLSLNGSVMIDILLYNILGNQIGFIAPEQYLSGARKFRYKLDGLRPSVYLCTINSGNFSRTRKFAVVKER